MPNTNHDTHDTLFTTPLDKSARFSFDEEVVACFPDMIRRSVPGYGQVLAMLPILARRHCLLRQVSDRGVRVSRVYDLGTSLGAVSFALADKFAPDELEIHAIDISAPMIERAKSVVGEYYPDHDIRFWLDDVCQVDLLPCDLIIINLTLQFLPPDQRLLLLQKCHHALAEGGILILTEKTHLTDEQDDAWRVERYYDFKRANGYSDMEISGKRNALENVLITDTLHKHHERLAQAGFERSLTWFMFLNFASIVAFK
ncbi:carboxy-S-adenosyl-L-methionine synthase CmoA [Moraxella catarrhalis]|uniref:Carboxy-S-adenosyl-L-methionine synthase n=1 Tax=Moraxella catarrhalis TaxID=480 RepID=A0A3A9NA67_MORCA|nr:carboxy-S-adenosyl-L-methionine synthase CmoA [Moraxella catarrhalis]AZQ93405.1 tRNA (cmo5U34)-methyltransferase [Moraxella catarrhalis]AZQ94759.1 tRNA (cmo5U34)-methyltransferase [Moraxella catarrhalis]EGE19623.1 tRNA (cmo5U34)-methyltransferase [Moraxella catarrhalis BC8]MCG6814637.1 carboxy-S-adenosyl-L-methionine synthase CmoA [Moraxella catarrhalis]MPW50275.1 carboxy-S-adenosyl-L-methionine synthase CmoA [Moraxella catarrhalis]